MSTATILSQVTRQFYRKLSLNQVKYPKIFSSDHFQVHCNYNVSSKYHTLRKHEIYTFDEKRLKLQSIRFYSKGKKDDWLGHNKDKYTEADKQEIEMNKDGYFYLKEFKPLKPSPLKNPKSPNFHGSSTSLRLTAFNDAINDRYMSDMDLNVRCEIDLRVLEGVENQTASPKIIYSESLSPHDIIDKVIPFDFDTDQEKQYPAFSNYYEVCVQNDGLIEGDTLDFFFNRIYQRSETVDYLPSVTTVFNEYIPSLENGYMRTKDEFKSLKEKYDELVNKPNRSNDENCEMDKLKQELEANHRQDLTYFISRCKGEPPFTNELLMIPLHHGNHWTLLVVDFKLQHIMHLNSCGCMGRNLEAKVNIIRSVLSALAWYHCKREFNWDNWHFGNYENREVPQQPAGNSCGAFVCNYAEFYARRAPINFLCATEDDAVGIRYRVLGSIIDGAIPGDPTDF